MGCTVGKFDPKKQGFEITESYLEETQCLTPCTGYCKLKDDVCEGCGRTRQQIVSWKNKSRDERIRIMRSLKESSREI